MAARKDNEKGQSIFSDGEMRSQKGKDLCVVIALWLW